MERRNFFKIMGVGAAAVAVNPSSINQTLFADNGNLYKTYKKVQLIDTEGMPVRTANLKPETAYVFNYPHAGTPAFLTLMSEPAKDEVKLKSAKGEEYVWKAGVGPKNNIVAYSAICAHALAHPTKKNSAITYVPKEIPTISYADAAGAPKAHNGLIVCSVHLTAFDPKQGGKVLSGPAEQPLASIVIEHRKKCDTIWAVGVLGPTMFSDYFKLGDVKKRLKREFGKWRKGKKLKKINAELKPLAEYSESVLQF